MHSAVTMQQHDLLLQATGVTASFTQLTRYSHQQSSDDNVQFQKVCTIFPGLRTLETVLQHRIYTDSSPCIGYFTDYQQLKKVVKP